MNHISAKRELVIHVAAAMTGDTGTLLVAGLNKLTGAARSVAIYDAPVPDAPFPYVRLGSFLETPMDEETVDYGSIPKGKIVAFTLETFSDFPGYEELHRIQDRLVELFQHRTIDTTNFLGYSWLISNDSIVDSDSRSVPNQPIRHGITRFRAVLNRKS